MIAVASVANSAAEAQNRIGPSFKCDAPSVASQPLAQIICSSSELASEEMRYVIAYQALRHSLDDAGKQALVRSANELVAATTDICQIPKTGRITGAVPSSTVACIKQSFDIARRNITNRLTGDAALEASLTPGDALHVQRLLKEKGILPQDAVIDGVFGPATRAAISQYQRLNQLAATGYATRGMLTLLPSEVGSRPTGGYDYGKLAQAPPQSAPMPPPAPLDTARSSQSYDYGKLAQAPAQSAQLPPPAPLGTAPSSQSSEYGNRSTPPSAERVPAPGSAVPQSVQQSPSSVAAPASVPSLRAQSSNDATAKPAANPPSQARSSSFAASLSNEGVSRLVSSGLLLVLAVFLFMSRRYLAAAGGAVLSRIREKRKAPRLSDQEAGSALPAPALVATAQDVKAEPLEKPQPIAIKLLDIPVLTHSNYERYRKAAERNILLVICYTAESAASELFARFLSRLGESVLSLTGVETLVRLPIDTEPGVADGFFSVLAEAQGVEAERVRVTNAGLVAVIKGRVLLLKDGALSSEKAIDMAFEAFLADSNLAAMAGTQKTPTGGAALATEVKWFLIHAVHSFVAGNPKRAGALILVLLVIAWSIARGLYGLIVDESPGQDGGASVRSLAQAEKALVGHAFRYVQTPGDGREYEISFAMSAGSLSCTLKARAVGTEGAAFDVVKAGPVKLFAPEEKPKVEIAADCYEYVVTKTKNDARYVPATEQSRAKAYFEESKLAELRRDKSQDQRIADQAAAFQQQTGRFPNVQSADPGDRFLGERVKEWCASSARISSWDEFLNCRGEFSKFGKFNMEMWHENMLYVQHQRRSGDKISDTFGEYVARRVR